MKEIRETVAERFVNDTAEHEMTILHDDGLYRHIRCKAPKNGFYWFDLITWPGYLAFVGDGTGYTFARTRDMFEFFATSAWKGKPNLSYWAEKVKTDRDSLSEYSIEMLKAQVAEELKEAEEEYPGVTEAWEELTGDTWNADYNLEYEHDARRALSEFEYGTTFRALCSCGRTATFDKEYEARGWRCPVDSELPHRVKSVRCLDGFKFSDTSDWDLNDYAWWFVWACHAIIWGIAKYNEAKVEVVELPEPDAAEEHF